MWVDRKRRGFIVLRSGQELWAKAICYTWRIGGKPSVVVEVQQEKEIKVIGTWNYFFGSKSRIFAF